MKNALVFEELVKTLCNSTKQRRRLYFYYESKSPGNKKWREVAPYSVGINIKGNLKLAALLITELSKEIDERNSGHYLLKIIEEKKFEVLSKTFEDPGVPRK